MRNVSLLIRKKAILLVLAAALVFTCMPAAVFAGSGNVHSMKVYEVYKSGNTVYCATYGGIYSVNLRTKKSKRLVKSEVNEALTCLKKKGNYIYYMRNGMISNDLYRVRTNGKSKKELFDGFNEKAMESYAIYKNKIYITYGNGKHKVMKLNGKSQKSTSSMPKMIEKKSNKKGYKLIEKIKGDYWYSYLKTPSKKILICKTELVF